MILNVKDYIAPCFYELYNMVLRHEYMIYRLKGGRGSTKSTFIAIMVLILIMRNKFACAVVFMKQQSRLRTGAFALYRSVIARLGLGAYFKISLNPMTITYKPTGQVIYFLGLDDASKTKGITVDNPSMYIAISHFEELDQFAGVTEIETALQSITRGGDITWCFQCYNPPQNRNNWCNRDSLLDIPGRIVHTSDYRMVPKEWLGKPFFDQMRITRLRSERDYQHMYLGIPTGTGGSVFENIKDITLTDEQVLNFDNMFNGQDWGFYPDPAAFVRWYYDKVNKDLYLCAESIKFKSNYASVARDIIDKGFNDTYTILDSARGGEMLTAFRDEGVLCDNMYKGKSGNLSREFGIQWLQTRRNIFIDKSITPKAYEEFISYEYERNLKTGEILNRTISFNDHTIDASRYALSPFYQRYPD